MSKILKKKIGLVIMTLVICIGSFGLFVNDAAAGDWKQGFLWNNPIATILKSPAGAAIEWGAKTAIGTGLVFLRKVSAVALAAAMDTLNIMINTEVHSQVFFSAESRQALNVGWGLVRDFINMFYILILLFLAIATILRVNRFSDKKLMISVVASALLVNFSAAITLAIIDFSNLAMSFFSTQIDAVGANFTAKLADSISFADVWTDNAFFNTDGALIAGLAEIIFTAILAITLFVLAIALIIRMVAFWVLIVLSPLAFFGLALPNTGLGTLWKGWLSRLTAYAFFGPVLLFFLWLSLVMITALSESKDIATIPGINDTPAAAGDGLDGFAINFLKNTIPFVAAIYMLFYGFSVSKSIADKAGGAVSSLFSKGQGWMSKGGKYAAIAGTGVAGVAAYAGYSYGKDRAIAAKEKLEESDSRWRLITPKGRENASKDRRAKFKDPEGFERGKANEAYNNMKKEGLTKDEVVAALNDKDKFTAAGAAKLAADNGWLANQEDYNKAHERASSVKGMQGQFEKRASEKNLNSVLTHRIAQDPSKRGEVLQKAFEGKGVDDFAKQNMEFFQNEDIWNYLKQKYAAASPQAREAARKKAQDKISDTAKYDAMMEIIG